MAYAIYRCTKVKTLAKLAQTCKHNLREHRPTHSDPRGEIRVLTGSENPADEVVAMLPDRRRKDAVLCMELLLTASPEYFRPHAPEQRGIYREDRLVEWQTRAEAWLQEQFGDNLVSAVLHLDEATPHIQALVVPLDRKTGRLAAKRLFGPEALKAQQDTYAAAMADLGLHRGQPGSKAQHEPLRRFYQRVGTPLPPAPKKPRLGPAPKPTLVEKIAAKLGIETDYERRRAAYEMQRSTALAHQREWIAQLAAKAAEFADGEKAGRQARALRRLLHEAADLVEHQPEAVEAAVQRLDPADRAAVAPLIAQVKPRR